MQKKVVLCAINARYIHSNLAVRYLKKYCESQIKGIDISEFSINDSIYSILKDLYSLDADIYGFSCYIWNIGMVLKLCSSLKKAKPEAVIILGGPEVSYDPAAILAENASADYIVIGEGEETLLELLGCITDGGRSLSEVKGIAYRKGTDIVVTPQRPLIPGLDLLPFPYDSFEGLKNKVVYYETSRGCPFNCQYCLSSTISGVRYLSMDRLQKDIRRFAEAGIKQVKLVDRTFNCDVNRSIEIMQYIIKLNPQTNFHFEIAADLINERFLETVEIAPDGMFQFEIGVQSTNPMTLHEIKRAMDFGKVRSNVARLVSFRNAHIHLDLIAGLPYEDMNSFEKSFNDVYELKPDMLQLGFLKLLKGSGIRERRIEYGIEHHDFPPYEVIKTHWLSYKELLMLKDIEHVLEQYYNSGRFRHTLDFLLQSAGEKPFAFFRSFSEYWNINGHFGSPKSINELYTILQRYASAQYADKLGSEHLLILNEYLKLDWLLYGRSGSMPETIERFDHSLIKERLQEFLKNSLPAMKGFEDMKDISMREMLKQVGYEVFFMNIFESVPSRNKIVLFYKLKPDSKNKYPFFTAIPLSEIIAEV